MNVFLWHVHGSWATAFVQGRHRYLVPVTADRGPDGLGRAGSWEWPDSVVEVTREEAAGHPVDVVVLQRPSELERLAREWLGREPGRDLAAVYLEHNAPQGRVNEMRHPAADRPDLTVVHVTHFNRLFWDCGATEVTVIEHGIVDPGPRWTGELRRVAAVVNEPLRRGRYTGTDLLPYFAQAAPLDVFGMGVRELPRALGEPGITAHEDLPQARMHAELARRRIYLHPFRWTSLGLSLIEAMHLGMPVVALATTDIQGHSLPVFDGSTFYPWAERLLLTAELGANGGVWQATLAFPSAVEDISGVLEPRRLRGDPVAFGQRPVDRRGRGRPHRHDQHARPAAEQLHLSLCAGPQERPEGRRQAAGARREVTRACRRHPVRTHWAISASPRLRAE